MTCAYAHVGTALIDHLVGRYNYEFTFLNRSDRPDDHLYNGCETLIADVAEYEPVQEGLEEQDVIVHLAAYPYTDGTWDDALEPNIIDMYNVLEACPKRFVAGDGDLRVGPCQRGRHP